MFVLDTHVAQTLFGEDILRKIEIVQPDPNVDITYYKAESLSDIIRSIGNVVHNIVSDDYLIFIVSHDDNSVKVVFIGSLDISFDEFEENLGPLESLWNFGVDIENIYILDSMHFFDIATYPYHQDSGYKSPDNFDDKLFTCHAYSVISRDPNLLTLRHLSNPNIKGDYLSESPSDVLNCAIPIDPNLDRKGIFMIYSMALYAFANSISSLVRLNILKSIAEFKTDPDVFE